MGDGDGDCGGDGERERTRGIRNWGAGMSKGAKKKKKIGHKENY